MANRKISDLTALTTLADGDLFVVADVSETGDAANKKITKANLMVDVGAYVDDATLTLTNKTVSLTSNTVSGTTAEFNTALSDGDFATLAGSETLTNKTLTSPIMTTPTLGAATGTSLNLTADSNQIVLDSDGTTTTITDSATVNRVLTLPDLTTTLVGSDASAVTDNSIVRMDGTTGKLIQGTGSISTINDSGTMVTPFYVASNDGISSFVSFSFSGDNDTGVWSPADNTVGLQAGGVTSARFNTAATAVNYFDFTPSATGNSIQLAAAGSDTDINILLAPKGTSGLITSKTFIPSANDGAALGTSSNSFSDLFLASGAVINFASSNTVLTHSSGILTVSTGDLRVTTAGTNTASVVTVGGTQTLTSKTLTSPVLNTGVSGTALAAASDINTGTSTSLLVTPDALAGAQIGKRVVQIKVFDDATAATTGDGKVIFMIPVELNGMNLVDVEAYVSGVSSSGALTIQVRNVTDAQDMLSTAITIDQSENSSLTAATPPVINASFDDVATGDLIAIDVDGAGTSAEGLGVIMSFQLP